MYAAQIRLVGVLGISLNPLTLAKDFANAVASAVLGSVGKGASAIVRALLGFVTSTSDPSFSSGWWSTSGTALFERVTAVTGSLLALAFMCSIITAMISGDRSLLARAFIRLPVAVLQIALVVTVTGALVAASDQVAAEIAKGATTNLAKFVALDMIASITGSGIVGLICGGLMILAALAVWAELLVRSALIYLAVLTAPLVFAAGVHPSVSGLKRRYIERCACTHHLKDRRRPRLRDRIRDVVWPREISLVCRRSRRAPRGTRDSRRCSICTFYIVAALLGC